MSYRGGETNDRKIYVGNLPGDVRKRDLEDIFVKYGSIVDVDLHTRKSVPFAFIEFEDPRDAEDAIRGRDGYLFDGVRIKVEFPRNSSRGSQSYNRRGGGRFQGRADKPKGYQLLVSGLPPTGSWQDIKDHFREAGDVLFADAFKDGTGVIEFSRYEHMKRALRDLDDSKFKSHEGETAYIRVKSPEGDRSRSPSPYQRRSPRYDYRRSRSRSYSRSRSRSPPPRRYY